MLKNFEDLKGQVLVSIERLRTGDYGDDELIFTLQNGDEYKLYHSQDCCEDVRIEDIEGNLDDLIRLPILQAEEVARPSGPDESNSYTWTFYKLATLAGYVTIRWYGESNGYYSESVNWAKV